MPSDPLLQLASDCYRSQTNTSMTECDNPRTLGVWGWSSNSGSCDFVLLQESLIVQLSCAEGLQLCIVSTQVGPASGTYGHNAVCSTAW